MSRDDQFGDCPRSLLLGLENLPGNKDTEFSLTFSLPRTSVPPVHLLCSILQSTLASLRRFPCVTAGVSLVRKRMKQVWWARVEMLFCLLGSPVQHPGTPSCCLLPDRLCFLTVLCSLLDCVFKSLVSFRECFQRASSGFSLLRPLGSHVCAH